MPYGEDPQLHSCNSKWLQTGLRYKAESSPVLCKCCGKGFAGTVDQMIGKEQGNAGRSSEDNFLLYPCSEHGIR